MDIISKKTYEKFPITIDFSPDLVLSETISSYVLTCFDTATNIGSLGIIVSASNFITPMVSITIQNGNIGEKHHIQVIATTNLGNTYDKDILVDIDDSVEGSFTKQPGDKFIISSDFTNKLAVGEILSSRVVTATKKSDGTDATISTIYSSSIDGNKVLIGIQNGIDGEFYQIKTSVLTSDSNQYQMDILMIVQEF